MAWQQKNFVLREPTAGELAEHSQRLELMLGLTLHVYSVASHSMPEKLSTIRGRLWQLEDSRELAEKLIGGAKLVDLGLEDAAQPAAN